jgi:hypothetical protein
LKDVPGIAEARAQIGAFTLSDFATVIALAFCERANSPNHEKDIDLLLQSDRHNYRLLLRFSGVRGLRLSGFGNLTRITGLDIMDISDRQWEGMRWEISDFENGFVHFSCREARVVGVFPTEYFPALSQFSGETAEDKKPQS